MGVDKRNHPFTPGLPPERTCRAASVGARSWAAAAAPPLSSANACGWKVTFMSGKRTERYFQVL